METQNSDFNTYHVKHFLSNLCAEIPALGMRAQKKPHLSARWPRGTASGYLFCDVAGDRLDV